VSSFLIMDELTSMGLGDSVVCGDFAEASDLVCGSALEGDLVLTIGAGSIETLGKQILGQMQGKQGRGPRRSGTEAVVA
jgi:UDP-N-acetylmuramate-alanine ligase